MTPSTITQRTYNAIPGYSELCRILDTLRPYKKAFRSEQPLIEAREQLSEEVKNILEAGDEVPLDIADGLVELERRERSTFFRAQILQGQYTEKQDELNMLIASGINDAYQQLNLELHNIMEAVSASAVHLPGITNAAQAFAAGPDATESWAEISRLSSQYEEVRRVQNELFSKETHNVVIWLSPERLANTSMFANFFDVMPFWIEGRKAAARKFDPSNANAFAYVQWLGDVTAPDER